jgi:hypothetical protein
VVTKSIGGSSFALISFSDVRRLNSEMASMPCDAIESANATPRVSRRLSRLK